ncbi:MAG TPA: hypothetical protein VHM25_15860 [Polyangiaceae bacterium]|jgi:hypothetical protein|nr:hypothetical protein [Polyangiaceae bacterium]
MTKTIWWGVMVWTAGAGAFTTGCSSDADPGSSGASGAGGGLATGGAGGAHHAVPAQANLTLSVHPATGAGCPVAGQTYEVGDPKGPNAVSPGDRLIDGEQGAAITCSVRGTGSYTFSGAIRGTTAQADLVDVKMTDGSVTGETSTVTLSVYTPQLGSSFTSTAGGCTVNVIGDNVKPGAIWANVACPTITDPSTPGVTCSVGSVSTFVFENCDGT